MKFIPILFIVASFDSYEGYIFFILEAESTANEELMAFRQLKYCIAAMDQHLRQGHKKLPIVLPICLYHGTKSPYPHSLDIYECFDNPGMARESIFKPFTLIDLTVLSDDELTQDGLAFLMEMLLKHSRAKNFLTILKQKREIVREILSQLNQDTRHFMLKYIINEAHDDKVADALKLIQIFTTDLPEDKETIMTFAQLLEERGRKDERHKMAKNLLAEGLSLDLVRKVTELSDLDLVELEKA